MDFYEVLDQTIDLLRQRGRVTYRALKLQFKLDDEHIEVLRDELIKAQRTAVDDGGEVLVWSGDSASEPALSTASPLASVPTRQTKEPPLAYTPQHLTEKILTTRSALEGERKQVTVMFADIKDSTELIRDLDPEAAQQLLDPAIHIMMDAVHRFEGTVNQVLGDGIMSLFGAPMAHEDHAARACYAALAMQTAMQPHADDVLRSHGITMRIRIGLNSGEVVVRTIGNDLHMDYSAVGPTTHLASRMEQIAMPGSIMLSDTTLRLVEGLVRVNALGPVPVKGMSEPVEVYELTGASTIRRRLQAAVARGLTKFVGRDTEIEALNQARERAETGHGQVVAAVGEAGVGKSRLVYEFIHSHHMQGWLVLESASVSYGKSTPYFPVIDLLKRYAHVEEGDDARTIRAKVTGQILTLDETLQEAIPALLSLLDALPEDSPFLQLDPPQRRQRTLDGLKRIFLRESQVQPLLLVFEDLHWIDSETQALLDSLVESLPTAQLLLLVNYRPEYQHSWGSKTYYTQLRLDPLLPESAEAFLQALLGDNPSLEPLKKLLIERTEGNPFFLEESVHTLVETEMLVGEPGEYRLTQEVPTIQVPATVQAVLAARIDRLPQEEKWLLQTASVIGTEVPLPLLQTSAGLTKEALHRGLTHLQAAEFLYETQLFPERAYAFKHALTQNVAYQSLLTNTRQQVHRHIAQVLEARLLETSETQPELLAHHYTEAGLPDQAVSYWQQAGQVAQERSAHAEAIAHLSTGLRVLMTLPETRERDQQELTLCIDLGKSLAATKGWAAPETEAAYTRAWEICQSTSDTSWLVSVLWGLSQVYIVRADLTKHREVGAQFLSLAEQRSDAVLLLVAHWLTGLNLLHVGEYVTGLEHLEQAYALYDPQQHRTYVTLFGVDVGVFALSYMSHALWGLGYPEQAVQRSREALALAQAMQHPFSIVLAQDYTAMLQQFRRERHTANAHAEIALALCTEHGLAYYLAWATIIQGWILTEQGQRKAGIAQMQQGLTTLRATGGELRLPYYLALLAEAGGQVGQTEEGLRLLAEAFAHLDKTQECWVEAELYRLRGNLLLAVSPDNHVESATCFQQAIAIAQNQSAKSLELRAATNLARLWQSQGKRQDAYDLLVPVYEWFTEGFDTADLQEAKELLQELEE
ncbi:MAG: AAA family ATPase [bacterium]|nr:AAA family ATPase [bacterium]